MTPRGNGSELLSILRLIDVNTKEKTLGMNSPEGILFPQRLISLLYGIKNSCWSELLFNAKKLIVFLHPV
jgi:hypothetical protein